MDNVIEGLAGCEEAQWRSVCVCERESWKVLQVETRL